MAARSHRPGAGGDVEIFLHRQGGENLALLRHPADARERSAMRRAPRYICAAPSDAAARDLRIAHDGEHQRRFADAVSAEHGEAAALRQAKLTPSSTTAAP